MKNRDFIISYNSMKE